MTVHDSCYRKVRHRLRLFYQLDVCADQAEAVTHINQGYLDTITSHAVEDQSCRIFFTANAKRKHINLRFGSCKCRRNLQHMGSQL